jgi:S1-C subfamily serine protease
VTRHVVAAVCVAGGLTIAAAAALIGDEPPADPVVVRVELEGATNAAEVATGFVVGPGRVVTVAHVLNRDRMLVVRSGNAAPRPARVLREDRRNDLALIGVAGLKSAERAAEGTSGNRLLVRRDGRTTALRATIRRRIRATVRGPDWGPYRPSAFELAARVRLGDSGAPLVDANGRVAGVLFARASNGRGTAYAVSAAALVPLLTTR